MTGKRRAVIVVLTMLVALGGRARADDDQRWTITLGAFFSSLDTKIRLDAGNTVGTVIDFESTLGLPQSEALGMGNIGYQMGRKHRMEFTYFRLARTGLSNVVNIRFGDLVMDVPTDVNSFFSTDVYAVTYEYAFFMKDRWDFGLSAGLNVQRIGIGIVSVEDTTLSEEADVTAPLPILGLYGGYDLTKRFNFSGDVMVFALRVGDYEGAVYNMSARFIHQTFRNVGFGFGYYFFRVDVDATAEELTGSLVYSYQGPVVFLNFRF